MAGRVEDAVAALADPEAVAEALEAARAEAARQVATASPRCAEAPEKPRGDQARRARAEGEQANCAPSWKRQAGDGQALAAARSEAAAARVGWQTSSPAATGRNWKLPPREPTSRSPEPSSDYRPRANWPTTGPARCPDWSPRSMTYEASCAGLATAAMAFIIDPRMRGARCGGHRFDQRPGLQRRAAPVELSSTSR